jgi:hypothetical protein
MLAVKAEVLKLEAEGKESRMILEFPHGNAIAGSVASAVRFLIKKILVGEDVSTFLETSEHGIEILRGQIALHNRLLFILDR